MAMNRFYFFTLIVSVFLSSYLNNQIMRPFFVPLVWAMVLSVLFYAVYAFILKYIKYS